MEKNSVKHNDASYLVQRQCFQLSLNSLTGAPFNQGMKKANSDFIKVEWDYDLEALNSLPSFQSLV